MRTLPFWRRDAGAYISKDRAARWDGKNDRGENVSSGIILLTTCPLGRYNRSKYKGLMLSNPFPSKGAITTRKGACP